LRVFVNGTLKRGMWNHERFCAGALAIEEAAVCGGIYEMDCGLPVLQVPEAGHPRPRDRRSVRPTWPHTAGFEAEMAHNPDPRTKGRTRRGWGLVRGNS
jgi:hypothetical protein